MDSWRCRKDPTLGDGVSGFGLVGLLAVETNGGSSVPGGASRQGDYIWSPPLSLWAVLSTGVGFLSCPCRGQRSLPTDKVKFLKEMSSFLPGLWGRKLCHVTCTVIGVTHSSSGGNPSKGGVFKTMWTPGRGEVESGVEGGGLLSAFMDQKA